MPLPFILNLTIHPLREVVQLSVDDSEESSVVDSNYTYNNSEEMIKDINKVFDGVTYFVATVAGISLFIASIGDGRSNWINYRYTHWPIM